MVAKHAARLVACFAILFLPACATRGPLVTTPSVELDSTPFFPQSDYQCGPAALATVLGASGAQTTADALVPLVYLPERRGSLQVEMLATPRKFGRLSYVLPPDLDAILAEVAARRPVLVLHNYGLPIWPRWHYAVVVGYDSASDSIVLRSGVTRRQVLSARSFMRAWDNGERWAMVVLRPGETPVQAVPSRYLEAAADFERAAPPAQAWLAFDAAVQRWPSEPIAWIGRGTAGYRSGHLKEAARDYASALRIDASNIGARNNLAMTLLELGCPIGARDQLRLIDATALPAALRSAILDTQQRVDVAAEATAANDPRGCPSLLN